MKIRTKWEEREREMATSRASFHFFGGMRVTDEIVITADQGRATLVRYSWPLFWAGFSFVRSFFFICCANGVIVMEKWTKLPPGQVKKKTIRRGFLFTGNFGFRDVREFTAIAAVSVQMSETLFLKLSHLLVVYVREREYHLLWKEISFLSHFHVRRRAIYNSFTLGNVCRTPSVLFSPSCFFFPPTLLSSMPLFLSRPKAVKVSSSSPSQFFWLENKTYRGIAWALF
jgi:hypothetical protein